MPYSGNTHIDKALTNLSVKFMNNEYIAPMFMKEISVQKESDLYYIYNTEFDIEDTARANKTAANMVTYGVSYSSYILTEHALADVVTERDRANYDAPLDADVDAMENLIDKILLKNEILAAKLLFTTTSFSNNATLTTASAWKYNTTTSAPIQNVLSATGKVIASAGKSPNTMIIGYDGFTALKENPNVYGRIQYVERAIMTAGLLASIFELDNVYVGKAVYNSNYAGLTSTNAFVWGSDALVAYFDPTPSRKRVTTAATFKSNVKTYPYKVKKWRDEDLDGDKLEVSTMYKHQLVATTCAYLFKTVALS